MARAGARLLKICDISNDVAQCVWFDHRGRIHERDYEVEALSPIEVASHPRSLWPEINEMPDDLVAALDETAAKRRREKARRPKPGRRLKRVVPPTSPR
jgi:hypothetical protein